MYSPSMFVGGSSLIHLLASHPRVIAVFGLGALVGVLLQSPFGTPDVIGVAGYVKLLHTLNQAKVERTAARLTGGVATPTPSQR